MYEQNKINEETFSTISNLHIICSLKWEKAVKTAT